LLQLRPYVLKNLAEYDGGARWFWNDRTDFSRVGNHRT
jgi:hypothetical protein